MLFKKDRKIKNQEVMIKNRDTFIEKQMQTNLKIKEENKNLRFELEEREELIKKIVNLVNSNKYDNEKIFADKIKELVRDYQSIN